MVEFRYHNGLLEGAGLRLRAICGRSGISDTKREGDGATPIGVLPLLRVFYRADRIAAPACAVPIEPLSPKDGWCDDVADAAYNKKIRLPYAASHEELWREDNVYDIIGVLGWNTGPITPGKGSAIFLHVAPPDFSPTAGCIALALPDLQTALDAGLTAISIAV